MLLEGMGLNMGYPGAMEVSKSSREHGFPNILGSANRSCFWTEHVPAGVILNSWVTFYRRRTTTNPEWKDITTPLGMVFRGGRQKCKLQFCRYPP